MNSMVFQRNLLYENKYKGFIRINKFDVYINYDYIHCLLENDDHKALRYFNKIVYKRLISIKTFIYLYSFVKNRCFRCLNWFFQQKPDLRAYSEIVVQGIKIFEAKNGYIFYLQKTKNQNHKLNFLNFLKSVKISPIDLLKISLLIFSA